MIQKRQGVRFELRIKSRRIVKIKKNFKEIERLGTTEVGDLLRSSLLNATHFIFLLSHAPSQVNTVAFQSQSF